MLQHILTVYCSPVIPESVYFIFITVLYSTSTHAIPLQQTGSSWESKWESFLAGTSAKELPHCTDLKYLIRGGIPYQYKVSSIKVGECMELDKLFVIILRVIESCSVSYSIVSIQIQ